LLLVCTALLPHIALLDQQAIAGAPDACQRNGDHRIRISLKEARKHQGTLIVAPNGALKLRMPGGVDPCGGNIAQIDEVGVGGSAKRDTLTLDRRRGLDGARLHFNMFFGGGWDTLRLLGTKNRDRARFSRSESSSPWLENFRWLSVGFGRTFSLQRVVFRGRGGADMLSGKPSGGPGPFVRRTSIHLLVRGGKGDDRAYGGARGDSLRGGKGNDFLRGGPGDDLLKGGTGVDDCDGDDGVDVVLGCEI
jgi:hypothetical protein